MKQALIIRTDLKMGKGKICAQLCHASLMAYKSCMLKFPNIAHEWEITGMKKIVLKVSTLDELLKYYRKAEELGLPISLIKDAGYTQIEPGSITAIGIGPFKDEIIDRITGELKLY